MPVITHGRLGNRQSYRTTWNGDAVQKRVAESVLREMESLASLIEGYLRSTLHRWTGEMSDKAFAEVDVEGSRIIIRFGSDAEHTFWHEVKYHAQIRDSADIWMPKLAALVTAAAVRAR